MGQVNTIVASLAVAHLYLFAKGRLRPSAFALALATAIKLTPVILIIYHLAKGRIRLAVESSLMLVLLLAASFLIFGRGAAGALSSFEHQTIANGQGFDLAYSGNQSIRAAESRLLSQREESRRRPYDPASLGIGFVLMIGALLAARKRQPEIAAAAPIFCCMVFLSPLAWKSHFVTLILPVAYLAARAFKSPPGLNRRLAGGAIAAAFVLFTLTSPTLVGARSAEWADNHSLVLAGALITFLAVLF
jgi:alpha-1,2-mannosyltransferase